MSRFQWTETTERDTTEVTVHTLRAELPTGIVLAQLTVRIHDRPPEAVLFVTDHTGHDIMIATSEQRHELRAALGELPDP